MGGKGDEKTVLKPIKPLAVRYNDNRRTLKYYKEQLKMKSKRSRLLIMAIADKLNEKEMEILKTRQDCDVKLSTIWQQLLLLQGNLNKEQARLHQVLQDKENIILSQRQEIHRLRHALEAAEKSGGAASRCNTGSLRRVMRGEDTPSSSAEDSSSPGTSPKQRPPLARSLSAEIADSGLGQDAKNSNLTRQKLIKGSERPKLKQTNSNGSTTEEVKGPKGILKAGVVTKGSKPPVPSRHKVNEMLGAGQGRASSSFRDSGNSSLDSSDPSSSMEWRLSVRCTATTASNNNINNNNNNSKAAAPRLEKKGKPPPPPRRSKSYERPSGVQGPGNQHYYEEYDLSAMDSGDRAASDQAGSATRCGVKKVSFQEAEEEGAATLQRKVSSTGPGPPQVPARTMFLTQNKETQPTFSSFKGGPKPSTKSLENSMIQKLDSNSVLGKLLNDSLITNTDPNMNGRNLNAVQSPSVDENLNITNVRGDYKYYF